LRRVRAKRKPIVLYQPRDEGAWMPLGLVALGSALPDEHVVIVDGRFEVAPEARVVELVRDASCLGVGVRSGDPLRDAVRVCAAARAANPRLTIVWGGPHATYLPQSCLATGVVDACIRGGGEEPFLAVVNAVRAGRRPSGIPGVVTPGGIVPRPVTPSAAESLPQAIYSLLDVERHFEARGARRLDYCSSRGRRGDRFCALAAERVLAELGELAERYRLAEVVFQEEDFFGDACRSEELVEGLASRVPRLRWQAEARPQDVVEGGAARLRRLVESGCRRLHVRPPGVVALRGALTERILEAAALLHEAGLPARFHLPLLDPGPGLCELTQAVSLARRLSVLDGRFETPVVRVPCVPPDGATADDSIGLEAWASRDEASWPDEKAERLLSRAAFFLAEAQREPGRRPGKHLLRMLSLLRVRLGFFRADLERYAVDASAVVRTGRPRSTSRAE
jgi:hypothetical protein